MGKDNTLLYLAVGGVAAYLLMPQQIREKIIPGGGGGVTTIDLSNLLEGLKGGGTTIIDRVVETIKEIPGSIPIPKVPNVIPDVGFPGLEELFDDLTRGIKDAAGDVFTTEKKPPGPPKYNIGDYVGAIWDRWEEFITGWQEPKEKITPNTPSEYALSVLEGKAEREAQQKWDDMSLTEKAGFVFTGRWPERTPKSEPTPYPDSFLKRPEPAPITEQVSGLTPGESAVLEFYWSRAIKSEPTPPPEPTPKSESKQATEKREVSSEWAGWGYT